MSSIATFYNLNGLLADSSVERDPVTLVLVVLLRETVCVFPRCISVRAFSKLTCRTQPEADGLDIVLPSSLKQKGGKSAGRARLELD